ncbi:hypothetical protein GW813_07920 [bacterium]|nr:hypothetical protein [bacterium]PJA75973.1 MAG: hypothetical protein CO151_04285 [bacterium CG_4_9_14_3_um_filter_65_15]
MQNELDARKLAREISILGVNQVEQVADNELIREGRDIPWLQDTWDELVWGSWHVEWRDVVILDPDNQKITTYNLTEHNLTDPANYAELKALLIEAAGG